ncbi:MAG: SpoIID/LytB domain-containing protein [Cyanobium sp.]
MSLPLRRPHRLLLSAALVLPLLVSALQGPVAAQLGRHAAVVLVPEAEAGPTVRVLLGSASRWELSGDEQGLLVQDGRGQRLAQLGPSERLLLRQSGSGITAELLSQDGSRRPLGTALTELWAEPLASSAATISLGTERYRGRLRIRAGEAGELQVINHLRVEHYLTSVVGSEMPSSWPQSALRAQAVAARTYALSQLRPASAFDLKATVASQVYRGVAGESPSTREAVLATRGEVLMQNGQLIQAVFHSSSGGMTEDSGQVWSRQLPYLVSVPDFDQNAPVSRWQVRLEPDQLRRLFRETDGVRRIEVLSSSGSGRIRRARVVGPAGALELSGTELRQRLGLRSTLVTFQFLPLSGAPLSRAPGSGTRWNSSASGGGAIGQAVQAAQPRPATSPTEAGDATGMVVDSATGMLMPAPRRSATTWPPSSTSGGPLVAPPPLPSPVAMPASVANEGATSAQPAVLVVEGRGFGHGVGMSQWGAHAMALQGRSYEQILRHYYRGVDLRPFRAL